MNILVLGSGGREHTFTWKIAQSSRCEKLFVAPGNAGTAEIAENVALDILDFEAVGQFVLENGVTLVVVGPEAPLVAGIVDYFKENKKLKRIGIIGPSAKGAMLEGSKDFSKDFMMRHGVPTAASKTFTKDTINEGLAYLDSQKGPYVLKADGLAAGKGVIITENRDEAKSTLNASSKVVIEQYLNGIELSVFVLTDGKNYMILPEAKDYKRIGEGDTGLNTGGMGAVSPVPFADAAFMQKVDDKVVKPTLAGLQKDDIDFVGFIFIGLMNDGGEPWVIEYNVRMGDPETQVVFPRIQTDVLRIFKAAAEGKLDKIKLKVSPKTAVTSVVVAGGYPEAYKKGHKMDIPEAAADKLVFHAGTKKEGEEIVTNGGRVMAFTGLAKTMAAAVRKSQSMARKVKYRGKNYRKDIGQDLLSLNNN
ncbi:UNVERIFIED_CONTAM: hypothetical protein GTU68_002365 [Idotea baltica]|nr:hypothetical protein [Idotea baltica]